MSRTVFIVTISVATVAVFLVFQILEPGSSIWMPKCVLHQLTGLHCPGCGATRAVDAMMDGDPLAAIGYNPLLILGGPLIALLIWFRRKKEKEGFPVSPAFCWTLFVVLLVWFVVRNIPSPQTSWFAPDNSARFMRTSGHSE